jgi:uncharacterized membrane protein
MVPLKTLTFAVLHMAVAFTVVYVITGNPLLGGAVAMIEPMVNTVAYFLHERVWERFGRRILRRVGLTDARREGDAPLAAT